MHLCEYPLPDQKSPVLPGLSTLVLCLLLCRKSMNEVDGKRDASITQFVCFQIAAVEGEKGRREERGRNERTFLPSKESSLSSDVFSLSLSSSCERERDRSSDGSLSDYSCFSGVKLTLERVLRRDDRRAVCASASVPLLSYSLFTHEREEMILVEIPLSVSKREK